MSRSADIIFEPSSISPLQTSVDSSRRQSKRFRPSVQCHHIDKQTHQQCPADGFMECVHCDEICCLNHITQHQDELKHYRDDLVQVRCRVHCMISLDQSLRLGSQ